ncbi:MAG: PIN domain-containing protein [Gaiellaceae bacterium]
MTLLDAYAVVALIADEPAAGEVEELLRAGDCRVVVANFAEAIDVSQRIHAMSLVDVGTILEPLFLTGAIATLSSQREDAWRAADLRGRHYHRRSRQLSLADCFLLGAAVDSGDVVATADPPLAAAARSEGLDVIALPDSSGDRP